jgi:hypothetical protein
MASAQNLEMTEDSERLKERLGKLMRHKPVEKSE